MFSVQITTPEAIVYNGEASALTAPGKDGSLGILTNHAPMISSLGEGELVLTFDGGSQKSVTIGGGFLQVENNKIVILADSLTGSLDE